jgi:hypothetical protein
MQGWTEGFGLKTLNPAPQTPERPNRLTRTAQINIYCPMPGTVIVGKVSTPVEIL